MSITNYSELQAAVTNWLHRDDLIPLIPDFVTLGESRINRDLRIRSMETNTTLAISSSSALASVPSDYVEAKHAYLTLAGSTVQKLERADPYFIYRYYPLRSGDRMPQYMARDGANFIFGPFPDQAYTVNLTYYKRITFLSVSNPTNWFIQNAPDIELFAALCEAAPYMVNDERVPVWEGKYKTIRDQIQNESDREYHSGSPLASSPG